MRTLSKKRFVILSCGVMMGMFLSPAAQAKMTTPATDQLSSISNSSTDTYQSYLDFFEKVYKTFEENYYKPVSRDVYNRFIEKFKIKIYAQLHGLNKTDNFVRWRSAALLVDALKDKEDIFSAFFPPKPAKEYEGKNLAKTIAIEERMELGITTQKAEQGYIVSFVEPRSDAYIKGLRMNDLIIRVDGQKVAGLLQEEMALLLNPKVSTAPVIEYVSAADREPYSITVEPKEFFKQTVFLIPTNMQGVYGLKIERFNQSTADDLFRYMEFFHQQGEIEGLILDLRENPGGPPLAAQQISAMFLPTGEKLAYFQKKGQPQAMLEVPKIPEEYRYDGPLVILVNKKSGSASELFSGILQRQKRAILMGDYTAGQVMLKSMFPFDDESMVLMITARGHHADGSVFSFDGVKPDRLVTPEENVDLIDYAQKYFIYLKQQGK